MKHLKSIIRLLVLTCLSLPLTPLTTVKAADAIQVDNTTSSDTTTATDSKTSTVKVTVLSGYLSLDAVPNFNFGNVALGSTVKLENNTHDSDEFTGSASNGIDGNDKGLLQVTDSRNLTSKENMPGFTVSASITDLNDAKGDISLSDILHLSSMPLLDGDNNNVSNTSSNLYTKEASLSSITKNTEQIINLQKGTYNPGVIKANFNTPDSASMTVPQDSSYSGDKTTKKMNAVITWKLTTTPTVTSN